MARRSSRLGVQIHSVKHIVDAEGALSGAISSTIPLSEVVNARITPFKPTELVVGETVNGIYLSVFIIGATGAPLNGSVAWYIAKIRAGQSANADFPSPISAGQSNVRSQIFHQEKGLAGSGDGTAMAFQGVIVIPKSMRRQRDGDTYTLVLQSQDATNDATFCVQAIYKSFS